MKKEEYRDIKGLLKVLYTFNKVQNAEHSSLKSSSNLGSGSKGTFSVDITDPKIEKMIQEKYGNRR